MNQYTYPQLHSAASGSRYPANGLLINLVGPEFSLDGATEQMELIKSSEVKTEPNGHVMQHVVSSRIIT